MKIKTSLFIALYLCVSIAQAQDVLTTKSGQQIIVAADGSWKMAPRNKVPVAKVDSTDMAANVFEMPTETKISMTRAQSQKVASLTEVLQAKEIESLVALTMSNRKSDLLKVQKKTADSTTLVAVLAEMASTKIAAKKQKKDYSKAARHLSTLKKLTSKGSSSKLDQKLAALSDDVSADFAMVKTPTVVTSTAAPKPTGPTAYPTSFEIAEDRHKKDNYPCIVTFDGKDPVTGKNKKEVKSGPLFTFTQDKLKPYFKSDDFLKCESTMTKVGKSYFLTLHIRIKSKDAYKTYGALPANEELKIEFIDGSRIYGTNIIQSTGEIEAYSGHTLYSGIFQLDNDEVKQLEKKLVDAIGILWSTGYEEYEVYNVDFLKHQTQCLKN